MSNETDPNQAGPRPPGDHNPRTDPPLDFSDREIGEMSAADYETLGFMSGLEVHQQLLTRSKLFCRCPAGRRARSYDAEVLRHMRPTLSELGEYDGTALMEFKTRKEIVYRLERGSVCTYEMDDTPPFEVDDEAVRIAIEMARLLNLNLVSELHVMRKQYLDGSIPTGFQRTAMVGLTGAIPFRVSELGVSRDLKIRQLSLEEDSCREIADVGHRVTFGTDRLGIPLTEVVTEPELLTPLELQAAGRLLAHVAQSTGKVRRGPGVARQDVNVSVAGGRRIEIKGVDNHRGLPLLVHVEAFRQLNLLRVRAELERRGVRQQMLSVPDAGLPWEVSPDVVDASVILADSEFAPIQQALDRGETVCAVRLPGFGGLLTHRTQPGVTFAREFADRIRVVACPTHRPFMIHSDLGDYGLDPRQWRTLKKQLKAGNGDAMMVVWADEQDAATAVRELFIRARDAVVGVPAETRQAFRDGTNGFERILPGPDRMYPDTDTPPLPIRDAVVHEITAHMPEAPWEREQRYTEIGLDPRMARHLARSDWADLFDRLKPASAPVARRLAAVLEKRIPHYRRRGLLRRLPSAVRLTSIVRSVESGEMRLEALERVLDTLIQYPGSDVAEVLGSYVKRPEDESALDARIGEVVEASSALAGKPHSVVAEWGMGKLMAHFLGKLDPAVVEARLEDALKAAAHEVIP